MSGPFTEEPPAPSYWTSRAIAETLAYGGFDRASAATLLALWRHREHLTAGERAIVLTWFAEHAKSLTP